MPMEASIMIGKVSTVAAAFDNGENARMRSVAGRGMMVTITRLPFGMLSGTVDFDLSRA
jgi:hypothetical protein